MAETPRYEEDDRGMNITTREIRFTLRFGSPARHMGRLRLKRLLSSGAVERASVGLQRRPRRTDAESTLRTGGSFPRCSRAERPKGQREKEHDGRIGRNQKTFEHDDGTRHKLKF